MHHTNANDSGMHEVSNASGAAHSTVLPCSTQLASQRKRKFWLKTSGLRLRLALTFFLLFGSLSFANPDRYTGDFEKEPVPDFFHRDRRAAQERQELYRKRIPIPDAVSTDLPTPSSILLAKESAERLQSAAAQRDMLKRVFLVAGLALLAGMVAICWLCPRVLDYLNPRYNPWALRKNIFSATVRAEDEAFTAFLSAFRTGPAANDPQAIGAALASGQLKEFFARAPVRLAEFHKLLEGINHAISESSRRKILEELLKALRSFKGEAGLPELLPVWQTATALEGLVKQLTNKIRNVTPSTLRTVNSAIQLLGKLCKPGLPADLLSNPPMRLLAVDDDVISRNAVSQSLKRALNPPDLAENGEAALALVMDNAYDVIFLDVQMPGMDGFELCTRIHETALNKQTPVVFVTCHSDFDSRAKSALSGGVDLIAKPFLTFEITVKALTLALQMRLARATQQQDLPENADALALPPAEARTLLAGKSPTEAAPVVAAQSSPAPVAATTNSPAPVPVSSTPVKSEEPAKATLPTETVIAKAAEEVEDNPLSKELVKAFTKRVSEQLESLRSLVDAAFQTNEERERMEKLTDFYLRIHSLLPQGGNIGRHPSVRMIVGLEGLVKKVLAKPADCTSSTLLTVAAAVDLLKELCASSVKSNLATNPAVSILVVDDDPISRRAISQAVQVSFGKPDNAEDGEAAVKLAKEKVFDLIFLDVQMPGMDGFAACTAIREQAANQMTPVIFVTGQNDFKTRVQATVSGGGDFIGKPFLTAELTLKALTFVLRSRLRKSRNGAAPELLLDAPIAKEDSKTSENGNGLSRREARRQARRNKQSRNRVYQSA